MSEEAIVEAQQSFKDILSDEDLLQSLDALGFKTPTSVQSMTLPEAIKGRDLVVEASTGSGKTFAFALPMLARLRQDIDQDKKETFGLVVAPTRELAVQIAEVIGQLHPDISPALLIGGTSYTKQKKELEKDPRIVIGTPGRMLDFYKQKEVSFHAVKFFVLDEADEMLSMGFIEDVKTILSKIPEGAQGLFVSATISWRVQDLAKKFLRDAEHLNANVDNQEAPDIEHLYLSVGGGVADKANALCDVIEYENPESAIIFCNTKSETELLEVYLRRRGFDARRLNSDLNQSKRNKIMEKIRAKELRFLIATDIAARGIDIEQIKLIVNYSVHEQAESYVHRTGRTGRAGRSGRALSLVGPNDFMAFKNLRQELDSIEFKKLELPKEEELIEARLKHLQGSLQEALPQLKENDLSFAKEFLKREDEQEAFLARLLRYCTEHLVSAEAVSLDEELKAESEDEPQSRRDDSRGSRGRNSGSRNQGNRNRGNRGRRGGRN